MIEADARIRATVPLRLRLMVAHTKFEMLSVQVEDLIDVFEKSEDLKPEERIAGITQSMSYLKAMYYELINTAPSLHK